MKKKLGFVIILLLLLGLNGCGEKAPESSEQPEEAVVVEETEVPLAESEEEEEPMPEEEESQETLSLDLLNMIQPQMFQTLIVETEMSGEDGLISKSLVYHKGLDIRTEYTMPEGPKMIMIVQGEEGISYQYEEGSNQGIMIPHGDLAEMYAPKVESELNTIELEDVRRRIDENMIIREETLDGEKVVYIEFQDMGDVLNQSVVKLWYSKEYAYPIRYELFSEGKMLMRSDVIRLEINPELADDLFLPPENIDFMEIFIEGGFEMPDLPEMPDNNE